MASGDVQVQSAVHSLDQGTFAFLVRLGMILVLLISLSLVYLFVQFRGLSHSTAMDQAQIARNLAEGRGYATGLIRPVALNMVRGGAKTADGVDAGKMPDFYQSPLVPFVNSFPLGFLKGNWKMSNTDIIYSGDRVVAAVSIIFFLLAVLAWFFVVMKLFDARVALYVTVAVLVTDLMWQFSLAALPQMLALFLFGVASLFTIFAMEAHEDSRVGQTLVWLGAAGVFFGLMTLAHGLSFWIFAGWVVFAAIYFRPRGLAVLAALAAYVLVYAPWMVRNYQVCGNPFGLAIYDAFTDIRPEESIQRKSAVQIGGSGMSIQGRLKKNATEQMEGIFGFLGINIAAIAFFASILHPFRNPKAAMFRWCVLLMWLFAVVGMCFFRPFGSVSENQFHVLFVPAFAAFGFAFLLVLWNRLNFGGPLLRTVFIVVVIIACGGPMVLRLIAGPAGRIQWPPYVPPSVSLLGTWFEPDEMIASDMPWAVAWYANRKSLLLPETLRDFNRVHDYDVLTLPIRGLYLTPISGNQPLFSGILKGPSGDWAPVILRPPQTKGFPFQVHVPLPIDGECIIFADRDRWSQPAKPATPATP